MKRSLPAAALLSAALLLSCAGSPAVIPEGATDREIVQRAQEASDRYAWDTAVTYYQALIDRYGSDPAILCAGEYEIAFIRYKQGRWAESRELLVRLLGRYQGPGAAALPERYRILAEKILPQVEAKLGAAKDTKKP